MSDWGWNPATIQTLVGAAVGLITALVLWSAVRAQQASRQSADAAREAADVAARES